jgi:hypothetical protein
MEVDFLVIENDPALSHQRLIDVGGCGEVHEVSFPLLMNSKGL